MPSPKTKALVVLSGGQDSTTCLFWALHRFDEVHAITFDYGQKHRREISCAIDLSIIAKQVYGSRFCSHEVVDVPRMKGRSPLTNPNEQLEQYDDHDSMAAAIGDRVELTFVPMRNAVFLAIAANRAMCLADEGGEPATLVTGVCQADNANYPDCRESFIHSAATMFSQALGLPLAFPIAAPLMHFSKAESIDLAIQVGGYSALAFSHTAYDGQYPPVGHDHATILRAHGFEEAGVPDPLVVRAWLEGKMSLPSTPNYWDVTNKHGDLIASIKRLNNWVNPGSTLVEAR